MSFGEPDPNSTTDQTSDWLEDTISYLPSFMDDPYGSSNIIDDRFWAPAEELEQELFSATTSSSILTNNSVNNSNCTVTSTNTRLTTDHVIVSNQSQQASSDLSKKRKAPEDIVLRPTVQVKKSVNRKGQGKSTKDGSNNKNGRWAEQLLNPCAAAFTAGNVPRVRHLIFVLGELASPTGDANYRLASHGLQALTHHLTSNNNQPARAAQVQTAPPINFLTVNPRFFQRSLINFNDINPWFTIPNNIANNSILQVLSELDHGACTNLHILDIGVSHGIQWPTLLEALSRRPGGPPPLVQITIVPPLLENNQIPFAASPPGYNFVSNILRFANDIKINLHINRLDNCPLQNLNSHFIKSSPDETLIVCAQFRLHNLNHNNPDNRTVFLKTIRNLEPKGVVLSDNNMDCSCNNCSNFETGFARRVDYLWNFLDSTSVAFKGREMEERKMMEGEASKALISTCEMNERKEKWSERMTSVGFVGDVFREDVMDGARALLRKYDSNWELRLDGNDKCIGLWWKGQPVSFCSLWKIDEKTW
ncbi:nodulation-signaling pathway 1 protein-like protein [Tanacetum coccineum]